MRAAHGGFAPASLSGLTVVAGRTVVVEIVLAVAAGSTVTVSASVDALAHRDPTVQQTVTEPLLRAAGAEAAPATAPAADLERARIYLATGRQPEAVALLEHLILTYPSSALVPQARRALDEAKGAVPAS